MGGRLIDWLGQGAAVDRPVAATVAGLTNAQGAVLYFANDTKILSVYDDDDVDWFDIDVVAVSSISFQTLPDVDWSTPPTDGQVFTWDTASSKLMPGNFPVTFNAEDAQDAIDAAIAAGTHVGISVTYDDTGNFFDFTVDATWVEGIADTQADARIAATVPGLITTAISAASIDDLGDVDTATIPPVTGDALIWDGVSAWVPGVTSTVGSIDDLSDVDTVTVAPVIGDTLEFDGTNWVPGVGGGGGSSFSGCAVYTSTATPALVATTVTRITFWDSEVFDTDSWHNPAVNPSRLTVPAGVAYAEASFSFRRAAAGTGEWTAWISHCNSAGAEYNLYGQGEDSTGNDLSSMTTGPVAVVPGDFFECWYYVGALTGGVDGGLNGSRFAVKALAAIPDSAGGLNPQTGTTYTIQLSDVNGTVELSNASAITLTVPLNSSVPFPINSVIEIHQANLGIVYIVGAGGVTILSRGALVHTAGQDAVCMIRKVATDTWRLAGDLVT